MLEAVNTVLQNASATRAAAEQVSTADSYAANPERTQRAAPQAPYVSPYIVVDVNYDKAVIQIRNGETGDVEGQYPSQSRLQQQARAAQAEIRAENLAPEPQQQATQRTEAPQQTAPAPQAEAPQQTQQQAVTAQQQAAFAAAAQSGNSNASTVSVFA
ncbi:MAG TPA: hypothetical protein EYG18_07000 [Micavibrio sp.]|nr:hypothetical protein [Micavibrio sp.]HIL28999.1 hypothetical protein [Micavibrio sp.]